MKANELMIGDWVYNKHHKKNIRLTQYDFFTHTHNDFGEQELAPFAKPTTGRDLEPIHLTPEILKKNGFETEDDVHFSIHGQSDILELLLVEVPFDYYYFDIVRTEKTINKCNQRCYIDRYFASVDYVHQLQHALRLCGIEKEIIL